MDINSEKLLGVWEMEPGFICVQDGLDAPAAFLIPHLLKEALHGGYKVIFVGVDQTFTHYQMVMRKLMLPLDHALEEKQMVFLDWLKEGRLIQSGVSLKDLYKDIFIAAKTLANSGPTGRIALFVDCLTTIRSLLAEHPSSEWVFFLQYCRSLGDRLELEYRFNALVHLDVEEDQDWLQWVEHVADVRVVSRPLDLISIAGVDGRLEVVHRGICPKKDVLVDPEKVIYYKLRDTGVKFMSTIATPT